MRKQRHGRIVSHSGGGLHNMQRRLRVGRYRMRDVPIGLCPHA